MGTIAVIIFGLVLGLLYMLSIAIDHGLLKERAMTLAPIGLYTTETGKTFDLREYYVDESGNLYSGNLDTWEISRKDNRHLLLCSNNSLTRSGKVHNSLRCLNHRKVTITRDKLNFTELGSKNGYVTIVSSKRTPRHLRVIMLLDRRRRHVKTTILSEEKI